MGLKLPTIAGLLLLPSQKIGKQVKIRPYSRTHISQLLVQLFLYSESLMQSQEFFTTNNLRKVCLDSHFPSWLYLPLWQSTETLWIPYCHHCCSLCQPLLREMSWRLDDVPSPFPRNTFSLSPFPRNTFSLTINMFHINVALWQTYWRFFCLV